jgi:hypothetical protein
VNPFLFIVGCAGSGTTLLRRMLDAHPDLAVIAETRWVTQLASRCDAEAEGGPVDKSVANCVIAHPRFHTWGIEPEPLLRLAERGRSASIAEFGRGFFDLYGKAQQKPLVGDKTSRYVRHLQRIHYLWPNAKFVHLIRDGRDAALSILDWLGRGKRRRGPARFPSWSQDPVATVALWWELQVRQGREDGMRLGPQLYHEVRYESLIARPAEESALLCEFLGLPRAEGMLRFHNGGERHQRGLSAKNGSRPITAGLRDWRSEMAADDVERFEAAARAMLSELGYPLALREMQGARERTARARGAFTEAVRAAGTRLPDGWTH